MKNIVKPIDTQSAGAFLRGMGSVLDIMPSPRQGKIFFKHAVKKDDREALRSDVTKIASDFQRAMAASINR